MNVVQWAVLNFFRQDAIARHYGLRRVFRVSYRAERTRQMRALRKVEYDRADVWA